MDNERYAPDTLRVRAIADASGALVVAASGQPLLFKPGARVKLITHESALVEQVDAAYGSWRQLLLVPANSPLRVELTLGESVTRTRDFFKAQHGEHVGRALAYSPVSSEGVHIWLAEDLLLNYAPGKRASLVRCKCFLPSMNITVDSLNQAYTRLSEAYEIDRSSHTGSVFRKCFHLLENGKTWQSLEILRARVEEKADA